MEFITNILNFFTDSTKRLTTKAITFILIVSLVWLVDNTLSFTYYYNIDNKIEHIEKINKILIDTSVTNEEKDFLFKQKREILSHNTFKDNVWYFFRNNSIQYLLPHYNSNVIYSNNNVNRNPIVHFVTSSFLIIIIMLVVPYVAYSDASMGFVKATIMVVITELVLYGTAFIIANLFNLIPIILNNANINYVINVVINILFVISGYVVSKKQGV